MIISLGINHSREFHLYRGCSFWNGYAFEHPLVSTSGAGHHRCAL